MRIQTINLIETNIKHNMSNFPNLHLDLAALSKIIDSDK
jgi:hypothetical protein